MTLCNLRKIHCCYQVHGHVFSLYIRQRLECKPPPTGTDIINEIVSPNVEEYHPRLCILENAMYCHGEIYASQNRLQIFDNQAAPVAEVFTTKCFIKSTDITPRLIFGHKNSCLPASKIIACAGRDHDYFLLCNTIVTKPCNTTVIKVD